MAINFRNLFVPSGFIKTTVLATLSPNRRFSLLNARTTNSTGQIKINKFLFINLSNAGIELKSASSRIIIPIIHLPILIPLIESFAT
ncbi:hypothetical protein D3C80_1183470 [compost metagenome]